MSVLASLQGTGQLTQVPWGLGLGRQGPPWDPREVWGAQGQPAGTECGKETLP